MNTEGVYDYASFTAISDAATQHETNPLLISWIVHMQEERKLERILVE